MRPRQPPPRVWLMTDERLGEALWPALERLPRGAGIVFRHYRTRLPERRRLFDRVRGIARRRRLVLVLADDARRALGWRADGVHGAARPRNARLPLRTAPAHDAREMIAAARAGADFVFVSPVFPTRSHPGGRTLGPIRFGLLVHAARKELRGSRVVALGGVTPPRFRRLIGLGAEGWAAIDAWSRRGDRMAALLRT